MKGLAASGFDALAAGSSGRKKTGMKKTAANEGLADNDAGRNADCVSGFHGAQSGRKRAEMQAPLAPAEGSLLRPPASLPYPQ
jgi:hypothetical protein